MHRHIEGHRLYQNQGFILRCVLQDWFYVVYSDIVCSSFRCAIHGICEFQHVRSALLDSIGASTCEGTAWVFSEGHFQLGNRRRLSPKDRQPGRNTSV